MHVQFKDGSHMASSTLCCCQAPLAVVQRGCQGEDCSSPLPCWHVLLHRVTSNFWPLSPSPSSMQGWPECNKLITPHRLRESWPRKVSMVREDLCEGRCLSQYSFRLALLRQLSQTHCHFALTKTLSLSTCCSPLNIGMKN